MMKETRKYIVTDAGNKQYIVDDDIRSERYCGICDEVLDGADEVFLSISGSWEARAVRIPSDRFFLHAHPDCTPQILLDLMVPVEAAPGK